MILSLTTGIRTEEARALGGITLTWMGISMLGLRSRRISPSGGRSGRTVTPRRRSRVGPWPCRRARWRRCGSSGSGRRARLAAGALWHDDGLVFTSSVGTPLDASHVRRDFRALCKKAGIKGVWAPRELRHTFVSVMSESGVAVEEIARLAGHSSSRTTEVIYRHELRPVITTGADVMDKILV